MAVELMMGFSNDGFASKMVEETAVKEAASGLESVEKLIKLLSQQQQQHNQDKFSHHSASSSTPSPKPTMDLDKDYKAVADVAVSKFKRVISLLGRTRTGHARFRRAPVATASPPPPNLNNQESSQNQGGVEAKVYYATPIQQFPPLPPHHHHHNHHHHHPHHLHHHEFSSLVVPKSAALERKDSSTTINFSHASAANSFMSSLTGDGDSKQHPSNSSAFQITNLSQVSSVGKPPLSTSSLKRKCNSENNMSSAGKCGVSSGRCHCSKKR